LAIINLVTLQSAT